MEQRMNFSKTAPELNRAVVALNRAVNDSGLDKRLLELIKLRASQINGCGYCVELHVREALKAGIDNATLHMVAVWRESSYFDDRDRAVLALTESVTLVANGGVSDEVYAQVQAHFSDEEIAKLLAAIAMINVWNRLMVSTRTPHAVNVP
jgi:AhpD family alkylhydroperoxidase